jgi:hypothetical protein
MSRACGVAFPAVDVDCDEFSVLFGMEKNRPGGHLDSRANTYQGMSRQSVMSRAFVVAGPVIDMNQREVVVKAQISSHSRI